jgi:hypothetical protein
MYFDLATLAPHQHRVHAATGGRAAPDEGLLRRAAAPPAPDDRGGRSAWATSWPRAPSRPRSTSPKAATRRIDLGHVERGLRATLSERAAVDAIEATSSASSMRRADRGAGRGAAERIDTLYFTGGSTGLRLLAQKIAAAFPRRGRCAATASRASPRASGCTRSAVSAVPSPLRHAVD